MQKAGRYIRQSTQRSTKSKTYMDNCNVESKKSMCYCPTRWNSTHDMLKLVVELREVFVKYDFEDVSYFRDLEVPEQSDFLMFAN